LGVVSKRTSAGAVNRALAAAKLEMPVIVDKKSELQIALGVKAHPFIGIIDQESKFVGKRNIAKANMCLPIEKMILFALGEVSKEDLDQSLDPPPVAVDEKKAFIDRYIGLATLLLKNKQYEKAEQAIDIALEKEPSSGTAHAVLRAIRAGKGNRPQIEALRTSREIKIDGVLDEFSGARALEIGAGKAKAAFRLIWDERALYVGVSIADNRLWVHARGRDEKLPHADGIEVLLDPALNQTELPDKDDRHLVVTADANLSISQGAGENWNRRLNMKVEHAVVLHGTLNDAEPDTGYEVELSIPWSTLAGAPRVGRLLGVDLALNDANELVVASSNWAGITGYGIPSHWNEIVLMSAEETSEERDGSTPTATKALTEDKKTANQSGIPKAANQGGGCGCDAVGKDRKPRAGILVFLMLAAVGLRFAGRNRKRKQRFRG
jgi:hypothetical protein